LSNDKTRRLHAALVTRILEGEGHAPQVQRRAAFDNEGLTPPLSALVDKVALQPVRVTDDDVAAVHASGVSEDQIFELVVCAAVGQATRQYEAALEALAAATTERDDHAP
jgi:alkylhydroperoxidase family enzyme